MSSMSSPPSPRPSNQSALSLWRHLLLEWRTTLLRAFLPVAAALALPSLGIGALIWWRTSKTWDYRERWTGTWVLAITGVVVYTAITWVAHPLPSLFHALLVERQESILVAGLHAVGKLWLFHLCFAPASALILEWLHPRRVPWLARPRVPRGGKAGGGSPDHSPANTRLVVTTSPHSTSASPSSSPSLHSSSADQVSFVFPPPAEPLGTFLGGDIYEWVRGGQLCISLEQMWRHGTVVGEPGSGKTMTLLRLATMAGRYGIQVIFLDLKGSKKTAAQFVAAMRLIGVGRIAAYPSMPTMAGAGMPLRSITASWP